MTTRSLFLLPTCLFAACVGPRGAGPGLRVGDFVEAKGTMLGDRAVVAEIVAVPRGPDDKADKVEVTGPVQSASGDAVTVLGHTFAVDTATEYEDADRHQLATFTSAPGEWLRIKARSRDGLRARTLRQTPTRDQFKVTGEVRRIDDGEDEIDVGGVLLPLAQEVDLGLGLRGRRDPNDPLSLFLADDQKAVPFSLRLSDRVLVGGQAAGEIEWDDEFDLDDTNDRDRTKPEARGKLDALWRIDDVGSYALAEVSFGRKDTIREGSDDTYVETLELSRAYASLAITENLQVLVGRQDFDEEREWLYDEVLDGARAVLHGGAFELEVGGAIGREIAAEKNDYEDTGVVFGNARLCLDPDWEVTAYVLQRTDDNAAGFEPLLFGLRSYARPRYGLGHWLELGLARGDDGARPIRGHAFDVGVLYTFDTAWRPSLGAGIAYGSGARDGSSESGYRQSGLQDNTAKLGGVTSVRYYGELLDPELANLTVTTLCAAVRPWRNTSVSLLYHGYRQDTAAALTPDQQLRTQPTGLARDLGHEFDLVFGYRLARQLTVELVAARFEPGAAFAGDTAAHLIDLTARLSF